MGQREKQLIGEVIDSNFPNDGKYTADFERRVAEACGVPYAVAVTSGTAALFLGLAACGVEPGDEVIVPDITFIASANAVRLAGATPVLVDVDPDSFCIDPAKILAAISPRTKAIMPVHVSGRAADIPAILEIARAHGLRVVEDAAEALGSQAGGTQLGSFGEVGCFSFTANKTITTGQGGMAITKDAAIHQRLRELKDQGRPVRGTGGADVHVSVGYNFKFTDIQAAMGLAQLETLPERREHLRHLFGLYRELLGDGANPRVHLPGFDTDGGACPQWVDALVEGRDGLHDYLLERGIQTRKFWYPLHTQAPYRGDEENFPASTRVSYNSLWLPSAFTLSDDDIHFVCQCINDWTLTAL